MNWSAKTAGLLVDELGGQPGATVVWRVRLSWQGVPLLLGSWWARMVVTDLDDHDAVAAFIDENERSGAEEVIVASSHPFGLAGDNLPDYYRHVADAVLPQADRFSPREPAAAPDAVAVIVASGTVSVSEMLDRSARAGLAIGAGGRVLSTVDLTLPDAVCAGLLGALAADGSLIQVTPAAAADGVRVAAIARDERATVTLGVDVEGLPRLDA